MHLHSCETSSYHIIIIIIIIIIIFSSQKLHCLIKIPANPTGLRFKAWVCRRSFAGIAGSNHAAWMDFCLVWVLCVVR